VPALACGGEVRYLIIQLRGLFPYTPGFSRKPTFFFRHLFLLYLDFPAYCGYLLLELVNLCLS